MDGVRKTKIVCTIGPACRNKETIDKMINAGMNVARINLSHGNRDEHKKTVDILKTSRKELDCPLSILLDTRGPEIRIKTFQKDEIVLKDEQEFTLTVEDIEGDDKKVGITYKSLPKEVEINDQILIDDGKISLRVLMADEKEIKCKVIRGGKISNHKGINVPNVKLNMAYLNEKDIEDIKFGIENGIDYIAASFVRRKEDVDGLRKLLDENKGERIKIIAKIENNEGLDNFEEILKNADGIMVARGDMGVEVAYENLPGIQKKVIRRCREEGKIVITATQMLESMINSSVPTRAEITDVANAVFDGTSAIMLSGETAMGKYPIEAVKTMAKIAKRAEEDIPTLKLVKFQSDNLPNDTTNAVSHGACTLADDIKAKALMAITKSGYTAVNMAKFRPDIMVLASTPSYDVYNSLALVWGVNPMMVDNANKAEKLLEKSIQQGKTEGYLTKGDKVVVSLGVPLDISGNTNTIRVIIVE